MQCKREPARRGGNAMRACTRPSHFVRPHKCAPVAFVHNSSCAKSRLVILRNACSFIRFSDFRSCVQFPASSFPSASQGKGPNVTTHEHHRPHLWHVVGAPSQGRSTRCGRGTHHLKCWCVSASARWAVLPARSRAKKKAFAFERRKAKAPSVFFF